MTNREQMTIASVLTFEAFQQRGTPAMRDWTVTDRVVVRARIAERLAEAASERLARTTGSSASRIGLRPSVGHLLIRAGRRVAGEPMPGGSPAHRRHRAITV